MKQNQLSVHSENILPIIKKWLYSEKDIFLRELVSNATDALSKARILRDQGLLGEAEESDFKISIKTDKARKTVEITDTGIGMTEEEVEKYIAQIAFSSAEEFVAKHKSQTEKDPIIGHFGLGFYSAYMVARVVEIDTKSFAADSKAVFWTCDGSSTYSLGAGTRSLRGTQITLFLDEENLEYLEEPKLRELLQRYCKFMPFPIELNGKPIGNRAPLWLKAPSECEEKEYLEFHRQLYPLDPDPLFWVHLNVDYPFHLQGILYFPKLHRRFDARESAIQLYCNRVFVSDNCKDILPDYLMVLRGAIDSPDIPLNVSRSYLQVDPNVRQLSSHISKKVSDKLSQLYKSDRDKYLHCWEDVETIVKLGILQDEKFYERAKDLLIWKNSEGAWTTLAEYLERASFTIPTQDAGERGKARSERSGPNDESIAEGAMDEEEDRSGKAAAGRIPVGIVKEALKRAKEKKVYYASSEEPSPILQLYKEKKTEILFALSPIDTALIQSLEEKLSVSFQRIDGALDAHLLDPSREKNLLDSDGKTEASKIVAFIQNALDEKELTIEAKSLASDQLPALFILDENQRRLRDYMTLTQGKVPPKLFGKKTFVVNTNSKLIQSISRLQQKEPLVAREMVKGVYDLTLLSQKELEPAALEPLIARQTQILEKLTALLV